MFAALRQSYNKYDTILDQSTHEGCLYVGFIGVGAIWQNLAKMKFWIPGNAGRVPLVYITFS